MSTRRRQRSGDAAGPQRARGFTLIEMMIAISSWRSCVEPGDPLVPRCHAQRQADGLCQRPRRQRAARAQRGDQAQRHGDAVRLVGRRRPATTPAAGRPAGSCSPTKAVPTSRVQHRPALPPEFRIVQTGGVASVLFPPTVVADNEVTLTVCRARTRGQPGARRDHHRRPQCTRVESPRIDGLHRRSSDRNRLAAPDVTTKKRAPKRPQAGEKAAGPGTGRLPQTQL